MQPFGFFTNQISVKAASGKKEAGQKPLIFKKLLKNTFTTKDLENSLIQLLLRKIRGPLALIFET